MSGDLAFDAAWIFAVFLAVVVLLAIGITLRRYLLERGGGTVELAMGEAALTGFLAWLEAAPPGSYLGRAS